MLPCGLTDAEFARTAMNLAVEDRAIVKAIEIRKITLGNFNTAIKARRQRALELAGIVHAKAEPREVEVDVVRDSKRNRVKIVRLDRNPPEGEIVEERAMNDAELQEEINLGWEESFRKNNAVAPTDLSEPGMRTCGECGKLLHNPGGGWIHDDRTPECGTAAPNDS